MNQEVQISEKRLREILEENINLKIENSKLEDKLINLENPKKSKKTKQTIKENKKLKKAIINLKKENKILKKENNEVKKENNKIRYENHVLQNKKIQKNNNKNLKDKLYTHAYPLTTRKSKINETETIKSYVSRLFKILDYDYTNTNFKCEYQLTRDNKNRVDLFYNESKNKNFICECKKLNTNFNSMRGGEDNGEAPIEQIRRYLKNTNETNIGILTDGLKIQIHLKNLYTGELFNKYYDINLNHLEDNDLEILKDLSRKNFNVEKFINKYGQ